MRGGLACRVALHQIHCTFSYGLVAVAWVAGSRCPVARWNPGNDVACVRQGFAVHETQAWAALPSLFTRNTVLSIPPRASCLGCRLRGDESLSPLKWMNPDCHMLPVR